MSAKEPDRYVSAERMTHDDFGTAFTMEAGEFVYDAKTRQGPWATMTEANYKTYGIGKLGLGLGQKYQRQTNGHLHKVEG